MKTISWFGCGKCATNDRQGVAKWQKNMVLASLNRLPFSLGKRPNPSGCYNCGMPLEGERE
jgi:hypothetical protein